MEITLEISQDFFLGIFKFPQVFRFFSEIHQQFSRNFYKNFTKKIIERFIGILLWITHYFFLEFLRFFFRNSTKDFLRSSSRCFSMKFFRICFWDSFKNFLWNHLRIFFISRDFSRILGISSWISARRFLQIFFHEDFLNFFF